MAGTIVITSNASQGTDVTIRDIGIIIPNSGGSETFTDLGNLTDCRNSRNLRTLSTDDAHGAGSSTLILTDGSNTIDQSEVDAFLESLGETSSTNWGALSSDPTTTPNDGDFYYNTTLKMMMQYDSSRSKWLSVETVVLQSGRSTTTGAGAYYRGVNGLVLSATLGYEAMFDGTIVSIAYARGNSDAATFEVTEDGTARTTLASSALTGSSTTKNDNFSAGGVLAFRNQTGGATTSAVQIWIRIKWRA